MRPEDLPVVPEGESEVSGVGGSEDLIPDAHDLLDLLSLDVDQENLEEKSVDDGGRAISAGEEQDEGPQELWRDSQEELQKALNIQPGWPEITSDLGARDSAGPPMPPTSWMRRPVEGEDGVMAWRLRERRPCDDHQVPGQQPEKHQRLDQGRARRDLLTPMDGHQKAERQRDREVPGQQLGEHQRLDQGKGRRDRPSRDGDLQREMERQVVEELRRQNEELRNEVRALNKKIAQGHNHRSQTPAPKTPTTAMFTPMEQPLQVRRTPGGTQVPPGTPPPTSEELRSELPEIPPWPWSKFEQGCAQRRSGRVGNVDNVNDMNEVVRKVTGLMACWAQPAAYIVKSVGAGGTDREVLTAGCIPDGVNYVRVKDVMALVLHFE